MAVNLPSDLVADVMRNADPVRHSAAMARLQSLRNTGLAFASTMESVAPSRGPSEQHVSDLVPAERRGTTKASSFKGFEQMVLRNLFESLLPTEESGSFGSGPSAGVWRSMAADQLASIYAQSGGIGITRMLAAGGAVAPPQRDVQWPYFSLNALRAPGSAG